MDERFSLSDVISGHGQGAKASRPSPSPWRPILIFLAFETFLLLSLVGGLTLDWSMRAEGLRRSGGAWLEARAGDITRDLGDVASDVGLLFNDATLRLPPTDPETLQRIETRLLTFARKHLEYDQVRLLDDDGRELVRINEERGAIRAVPQSQLQDKRSRDYVVETRILSPGIVHVSRLDLNIENGQVQWPPNPQMRFSTRLLAPPDGPGGMLVLNQKGQLLLDRLAQTHGLAAGTGVWLVDGTGEYLHAPKDAEAWGFVLGHGRSLPFDQPSLWARLRESADLHPVALNGRDQFLRFDPLGQARDNAIAWKGVLHSHPETDMWGLVVKHPLDPWYVPRGIGTLVVPLLALSGTLLAFVAARGFHQGRSPPPCPGDSPPSIPARSDQDGASRMAVCQWRLAVDGDVQWLHMSPEMAPFLGLGPDLPPPMEEADIRHLSAVLRRAAWGQEEITLENRFVRPNGDIHWWRARARPAQVGTDGAALFNAILEPLGTPSQSSLDGITAQAPLKGRPAPLDPETGLPSYHAFLAEGERILAHRDAIPGGPVCVVVARIDASSSITDRLGRMALDEVTSVVANRIATQARIHGVTVGRLQGRDIGLLVVKGGQVEAMALARVLRRVIGETPIRLARAPGTSLVVTISQGLATIQTEDQGFSQVLKRASLIAQEGEQAGGGQIQLAGAGHRV